MKPRLSLKINCNTCPVKHLCIAHELTDIEVSQLNQIIPFVKCVSKNEHISLINDNLQNLYAVYTGSCKEYWIDENGNECVTNFYLPGDIIGIESIAGNKHLFSVLALEDTQVCVIPINIFLNTLNEYPDILKRFLTINSLKMQNDQRIKMGVTASEKISDFLLSIHNRVSERTPLMNEIKLSMSQHDISNYLGIASETVNRVFSNMKRNGIVRFKNKTFEILNHTKLQKDGRLDYSTNHSCFESDAQEREKSRSLAVRS